MNKDLLWNVFDKFMGTKVMSKLNRIFLIDDDEEGTIHPKDVFWCYLLLVLLIILLPQLLIAKLTF